MAEQGTDDFEWLRLLASPKGDSTALAKLLLNAEGRRALNPRVEAAIASALAANLSLVARLGCEATPPLAGCKAAA